MSIVGIVIALLIVGVILWGVNQLPMIDPNIKKIIYVVVIVLVLIWLLQSIAGGGWGNLGNVRIGGR